MMRRFKELFITSFCLFFIFINPLQTNAQSLRLLTINVWTGLDYHGKFKMGEYESPERRELRFRSLISEIRKLNPDVIFIQEGNPIDRYASKLADSIGFDEIHLVCNAGLKIGPIGFPTNLKEGMAILAKHSLDLEEYDIWKLSGLPGIYSNAFTIHFDESIFSLIGKISIDSVPFYLINLHLFAAVDQDSVLLKEFADLLSQKIITKAEYIQTLKTQEKLLNRRRLEISRFLEHISELPSGSLMIAAGDFNATQNSKEIQNMKDSCKFLDTYLLTDSTSKFTWYPNNNENIQFSTRFIDAKGDSLNGYDLLSALYDSHPRRIDYIFLSKTFTPDDILDSRIVFDSSISGIHISDHYGILSEIKLKKVLQSSPKELKELQHLKESAFEPLPILSYDTDVGLGYGAKIFLLNKFNYNESFDITLFNSTKGERWYRFVFSIPDFELRQGKIYPLSFDLTIDYDKWIKNSYFGIGNNSRFEDREYYTKEPLEINIALSKGFSPSIVSQIGLKYKSIKNFNFSNDSKLVNSLPVLNSGRVNFHSFFASFRYDTRNRFLNPSKGIVLQSEAEIAPVSSFTNVAFKKLTAGIQYYSTLFYPKTILALRLGFQNLFTSNLPVQILLPVGGNNTLRGYPQDRYLDKTNLLFNSEVRFPIYWRFGGIIGLDAGKVWDNIEKVDLKNWAVNPTVGLRFYMDTFIIRLDIGFGKETTGFYFNFGHIY
jgi:exonuclease III